MFQRVSKHHEALGNRGSSEECSCIAFEPPYSSRVRREGEEHARRGTSGVKRIKARVQWTLARLNGLAMGEPETCQGSSEPLARRTGRPRRVCPGLPSAAGKRSAGRQAQDLQARARRAKRSKARVRARAKGKPDKRRGSGESPPRRARAPRTVRTGLSSAAGKAGAKKGPCADRLRRVRSEGTPHVKYTCGAQAAPVRPCTRGIGASLHGSPGCPFLRFLALGTQR